MVSGNDFKGSRTDPYCGGTILNEKTILTNKRCFGNPANIIKFEDGHISAGIQLFKDAKWLDNRNHFESENGQQYVKIEKIVLHPNSEFNAAIVKLIHPLTFNSRVKPACLPERYFQPDEIAIISGWGHPRSESEGNSHTNLIVMGPS